MVFPRCTAVVLAIIFSIVDIRTAAQTWKKYPLVLERNPILTFPEVEGAQYRDMGDSWFFTAQVTGAESGKRYQIVTIFDRNYITEVILNFYQVSVFDYETGKFNTFTDYDLPGLSLINMKFRAAAGYLDVGFNSTAGDAFWRVVRTAQGSFQPFKYKMHCPGSDHITKSPFGFTIEANMQKKPVAFGAAKLAGDFTFYEQQHTTTYWEPGPLVTGSLTLNNVTERVHGTKGHIDRQIFPLYSGIFTPTGRQHSHEWRQINLDNGVDLAIWRQFARENGNKLIQSSGTTISHSPSRQNGQSTPPTYIDALPSDLTVEYISYAKYPRAQFNTLIPPPSPNMYLPSKHIIRSKKLSMELVATYTTEAPVAQLPIEYFEGPAQWEGTFQNVNVTGVGIFESTLGLYRDWELAEVLLNSISHLQENNFSVQNSRERVVGLVRSLRSMVSSNILDDHRIQARQFAEQRVLPALNTLTNRSVKQRMLEIANDFITSLALVST